MSPPPTQVHVALSPAAGPRVVGMRARARNQRVVRRVGAQSAEPHALSALPGDSAVLLCRDDVTFNVTVFERLPPASDAQLVGPARGPALLWGRAAAVRPLAGRYFERQDLRDEGVAVHELGARHVLPLSAPGSPRAATWALLRQAQKATDGIVSRNLNRPVSRLFSYLFLSFGMTPLHASIINLAIGLACAYLAAQTGYATMVWAGALFHFASAFDGVDGEMARTTLSESPRGAWIDTAVDNTTYVACLFGVTIGWVREGVGTSGLWLAAAVVVGVPLTLLSLMRFVRRHGPDGSLVFVDRCVARAAADSGRPALRVARVMFHLLRRDVFALAFFVLSFSGQRAAIPIAVAAGLTVALLTLATQRRRLVAAAHALSSS